jgi:aminoglycoside/choline kinase family phosphotransferase
VPRVLGEARDAGWVLLEDLGDETLAAFLEREPSLREAAYRMAVVDLAAAQRALAELPAGCSITTRAFDHALLLWEIDHFREWGLEARGRRLTPEERTSFDGASGRLAARIASLPRGFVHRDYQSTNLMVRRTATTAFELVWIDFQDAMLGPRAYDLVALLRDSYQDLDDAFVDARLSDYADACRLGADERAALCREFDLITVQRKLKDAGRFVFIERTRNDSRFMKFYAPTLAMVRRALARLHDDTDLQTLAELITDRT